VIIISDTNMLSPFAAGDALQVLLRLFAESKIYIPPAVLEEVQVAIDKGRTYLNTLLQAITDHQIIILPLTADEIRSLDSLPSRLNAGERQAIALAQHRQGVLRSCLLRIGVQRIRLHE
jgi:predicted nucleic acid-binding protein